MVFQWKCLEHVLACCFLKMIISNSWKKMQKHQGSCNFLSLQTSLSLTRNKNVTVAKEQLYYIFSEISNFHWRWVNSTPDSTHSVAVLTRSDTVKATPIGYDNDILHISFNSCAATDISAETSTDKHKFSIHCMNLLLCNYFKRQSQLIYTEPLFGVATRVFVVVEGRSDNQPIRFRYQPSLCRSKSAVNL